MTIGNSVTTIGMMAFYYCTALTSVTIPNSVNSIGDWSFAYCINLTDVTIGDSVNFIDSGAFYECSSLSNINVAIDNVVYDSRNNCNAIIETASNTLIIGCKNTVIPNTVNAIGHGALSHCYDLMSITIPNSVSFIDSGAFYDCINLTSIIIGNGVTSIGESVFGNCDALTRIASFAETPPTIQSNTFNNSTYTGATLSVPIGCKTAYQTANYWKNFTNVVSVMFGDLNADGRIDVADVTKLISLVLNGSACDNDDLNGDGKVDVADVTALIRLILNN